MVEFLLFCIATVGMTSIIVQGVIFLQFRQFIANWAERIQSHREQVGKTTRRSFVEWFSELIHCAQCTGFWCGLFCGLMFLSPESRLVVAAVEVIPEIPELEFVSLVLFTLLKWFCCGLGGSFLASLGCNMVDWVFYHKMNALRRLEEQDLMLAERQAGHAGVEQGSRL